jgi:hypothetical protein
LQKRNQTESPLLRLPGELRNTIYHYAVERGHIVEVWDCSSKGARTNILVYISVPTRKGKIFITMAKLFTLPLVCRQMNAETKNLHYRWNTFHFSNLRAFTHFIRRLSEDRREAIVTMSLGTLAHPLPDYRSLAMGVLSYPWIPSCSIRDFLPNLNRIYVVPSFRATPYSRPDRD